MSCHLLQAIFEEFNTLSVVYQQPAALFVQSAQYQLQEEELEPQQVRRTHVLLQLHVLSLVLHALLLDMTSPSVSMGGGMCEWLISPKPRQPLLGVPRYRVC
jgi:hypothetical protein